MAFCPNCGTPNTDQAEKCVSCGFEIAPKQKAKFKGTIMMSGVQAPTAPVAKPAEPAPPPQAAPAPSAPPAGAGGKNLAFEKTIMGPIGAPPAPPPEQFTPNKPPPASHAQGTAVQDFARAPTMEGQAPFMSPGFTPPSQQPPAQQPSFTPPAQQPSSFSAPAQQPSSFSPPASSNPPPSFGGGSTTGGFGGGASTGGFGGGGSSTGGFGNTGGFGDSMAPPAGLPKKSNTGKIIAIGCVGMLLLTCVIGGILFMIAREKVNEIMGAVEKEGDAVEWRMSLGESLAQIEARCRTDCQSASVYFHPQAQALLTGEAKNLTQERLAKLLVPTTSEARMLNTTDDVNLASTLALDATQCVRLTSGTAKIVACSVPDASGTASLRIIHMSGISSL